MNLLFFALLYFPCTQSYIKRQINRIIQLLSQKLFDADRNVFFFAITFHNALNRK